MKFDLKLFVCLFFAFVAATIIGTLSHEYGHAAVAKYFGYDTSVSYGYMFFEDPIHHEFVETTYTEYCDEIKMGLDFPEKEKFNKIIQERTKNGFWVTLGGPLQTMLTGTIGLLLIFFYRNKFSKQRLKIGQWILVFLSLFWLREPANLFMGIMGYLLNGQFSMSGDEAVLTLHLGLPFWSIGTIAGIIGLAVLAYLIFKIVPPKERITFILAGLSGGIFGYWFWLVWAGPILLP